MAEIRHLGREPRFRRGYSQFLRFVGEAARSAAGRSTEGTPEQPFGREEAPFERPTEVEILGEQGDRLVSACRLVRGCRGAYLEGIRPGPCCLKLDTGRVLWEGEVHEHDVLWAKAFPGQPLQMAADTSGPIYQTTRELRLLDGSLIVKFHPGLEGGQLEIIVGGEDR